MVRSAFSASLHDKAALIPFGASAEESGNLITFASDWLELDSPVEGIRFDAELALRQEIAYASYLSITTIIIPPPKLENREYLADYARAINGALASSWHINVSTRTIPSLSCSDARHSETDPEPRLPFCRSRSDCRLPNTLRQSWQRDRARLLLRQSPGTRTAARPGSCGTRSEACAATRRASP